MKSGIMIVFKKELKRFFSDRRTLISVLMPGVLIYVIYTFMGSALGKMFSPKSELPEIISVNTPSSIKAVIDSGSADLTDINEDAIEQTKDEMSNGRGAVLVIFPKDFEEKIATYSPLLGTPAPNVEIYYNSANTDSQSSYAYISAVLDAYESALANKFDINNSPDKSYDLATDKDISGMMFSMLMPMLLIMLLFSGCMAVAPESIAGEKERGTIASLLITPTKRSHIAIGKILALAVIAIMSGASSAVGVIASLPNLLALEGADSASIRGDIYSISDYLWLALIVISSALLFVTVISILSAFAKSIKEATSYISPLMIIVMLIGVSGMFGQSLSSHFVYVIPIYNIVQCILAIFSFDLNVTNILITLATNTAITAGGIFLLTKMFDSEKVMFNK